MSGLSPDSIAYVSDHAKRLDPDRHFVAMLAPAAQRAALMTLIAFSAEIGAVRASVSEPMIGQMKFAWWRDVLSKLDQGQPGPKGNPICEALEELFIGAPATVQTLLDLVEAREAELLDQSLSSVQALRRHIAATSVPLLRAMADRLSNDELPDGLSACAEHHGLVRALAAVAIEAEGAESPEQARAELRNGLAEVRALQLEMKGNLRHWPKSLRPLLPLYIVSTKRLAVLEQSQNGGEALGLRPSVVSSLLAVWVGRV